MTAFDLTALDALAERATPGPWKHYNEVFRPQFGQRRVTEIQRARDGMEIVKWGGFDGLPRPTAKRANHNAAFIVAAINAYASMAAELRRLRDLDQAWLNAEAKIAGLEADLAGAVKALGLARRAFDDYAENHLKKDPPDTQKAYRNKVYVKIMASTISRLSATDPEAGG